MTTSGGPTSKLCRWACSLAYDDLPIEVRRETVTLLYDQVACMIASATLPSCAPLIELIRKLDVRGDCTVIGHPLRTSLTTAALANGTIGHGDEVDATGQGGTGHYSAVTVAACLTVGPYVSASGKEVCRALAIGSEVAARFQAVLSDYGTRNQFVSSVGAAMGGTVSAGLLLGLDPEKMENALGIAASSTCGLTSVHLEEMHQTKSLNRGKAVEAGVLAALLARENFHGPKEIMTLENGFFDAYLGLSKAGHEVVEALGENYLMRQIAYKRYPVAGPNQTPVYALLELLKSHDLKASDIEQMEVTLSRGGFNTAVNNKHPSAHMPTILSLAAVYGALTFRHINEPQYRDSPEFKNFQERVRIFITPRSDAASKGERLNMGLTVRTRNGATLTQQLRYPLMTETEVRQKFHYLAGLRLSADAASALETQLMAIEAERNVTDLVRKLEIPYGNQ